MKVILNRLEDGRVEGEEVDKLMWIEVETPTGRVRLQSHGEYVTLSSPDGLLALFPNSSNALDVAIIRHRDTVPFDGLEFIRK